MIQLAAVAAGAVLGAWLRFGLGVWLNAPGSSLPLGTLVANLVGGFAIGLAMGYFIALGPAADTLRLFVVTGLLGALTTFSTFSYESLDLLERGAYLSAFTHSAAHLLGSLACAAAGLALYRALA